MEWLFWRQDGQKCTFQPPTHEPDGCHGNRWPYILSWPIPDLPAEFGRDRSRNGGGVAERTNGRTNLNYSMIIEQTHTGVQWSGNCLKTKNIYININIIFFPNIYISFLGLAYFTP